MVWGREAEVDWKMFFQQHLGKFLLLFSRSVVSDSLQPHGLQHAGLPCPSPTSRVCWNSCPLSQWCHPTISSCSLLLLLPSIFPGIILVKPKRKLERMANLKIFPDFQKIRVYSRNLPSLQIPTRNSAGHATGTCRPSWVTAPDTCLGNVSFCLLAVNLEQFSS